VAVPRRHKDVPPVKTLRLWMVAARVPFLTGSVMPVLVCAAMAWLDTGRFHWGCGLLTVLGMALIHSGANLANDLFDHLSGNDAANTEFLSPFTGGSRVIQEGLLSPLAIAAAACLCLGAGCLIGLYLVWARGWFILALGLVGVLSAVAYTAPPFRLAHRGLGELVIALDFGLLPSLGAYYVQSQTLSWSALAAGLPATFLITAILFINQFPDLRADTLVGKRHWVVRLGRRRAVPAYLALVLAAPLSLAAGVLLGWLPQEALLGLVGVLPLPGMIRTALRHYDDPAALAPANAATIASHLLTGLGLLAGLVWAGLAA
jgi:1,4-dihydroxy-2-naphthoate octaprenyltransferase